VSLRTSLATPEGKSRYVRRLFATIARRYDFITVALSYGRDRHWKARLIRMAGPRPGECALDLACGTGDLTYALARRGAKTIGLDVTPEMIELACRRRPAGAGQPRFLVADMTRQPFPDDAFDLITTGYGLRSAPVLNDALAEWYRVLKAGGRLFSLDFNRPEHAVVRAVYLCYLTLVGSAFGLVLHGDPDTYRYIPESIRRYPGAAGVSAAMTRCGFRQVRYTSVFGGLMAIHSGFK